MTGRRHNRAMRLPIRAQTVVAWMLGWFVLTLAVAVAAPVLTPEGQRNICSATSSGSAQGVGGGESSRMRAGVLECMACLPLLAPPSDVPVPHFGLAHPDFLAPAQTGGFVPWLLAAPLHARGPPAFD